MNEDCLFVENELSDDDNDNFVKVYDDVIANPLGSTHTHMRNNNNNNVFSSTSSYSSNGKATMHFLCVEEDDDEEEEDDDEEEEEEEQSKQQQQPLQELNSGMGDDVVDDDNTASLSSAPFFSSSSPCYFSSSSSFSFPPSSTPSTSQLIWSGIVFAINGSLSTTKVKLCTSLFIHYNTYYLSKADLYNCWETIYCPFSYSFIPGISCCKSNKILIIFIH